MTVKKACSWFLGLLVLSSYPFEKAALANQYTKTEYKLSVTLSSFDGSVDIGESSGVVKIELQNNREVVSSKLETSLIKADKKNKKKSLKKVSFDVDVSDAHFSSSDPCAGSFSLPGDNRYHFDLMLTKTLVSKLVQASVDQGSSTPSKEVFENITKLLNALEKDWTSKVNPSYYVVCRDLSPNSDHTEKVISISSKDAEGTLNLNFDFDDNPTIH